MTFSKSSLFIICLFSLLSAVVVSLLIVQLTKEPIAQVKVNKQRSRIEQMMPLVHSNDLIKDIISLTALSDFGTSKPVTVYRARQQNADQSERPIGIVITPTAPNGYAGAIDLLISLNYQGEILLVRVLEHNESIGFGDKIHQDNSHWLTSFSRMSAEDLEDTNSIDQISGASVSSSAVTEAIKKCLDLYERDKTLFWVEKNE